MSQMSNIGHLITINDISTKKKEFIFLYLTDDEPTDAYKKVIQGIRDFRLPVGIKQITKIQADPVTDFPRIEREHPDTIGRRIHKLPVISFFDKGKKAFKEKLFLSGIRNTIEKKGTFFPINRLAAVVTGSDFFNREDIIKKIWKYIEKDQNVLLCGPRRFGKTSIIRELAGKAHEHLCRQIMIDLESVFTPQEFVARIWTEIEWPDRTAEEKNEKTQAIEDSIEGQWDEKGGKFFRKISKRKENLLFLLDECPYMLDSFLGKDKADEDKIKNFDREKTNRFIKWFREQRDLTKNRCVFLITGSLNLKPYLKDNGLDKDSFSDCKEVKLPFFDSENLRTYIESLLLGQEIFITDELLDELVRITTPGIPYFIQIVMNHVVSLYRKNPQFSIEDLRNTYHEEIIGSEGRRLFDTFERHFKRYGSRKPGASAILRELSNAGDKGLKKQEIESIYKDSSYLSGRSEFGIILSYLKYDFYIEKIKGTDRYRFISPILRDYWQKNQR